MKHPKIGIRPAIDGRRKGIRESLEDQTMNMARQAAELFSSRLRYTDGAPVECVIADTTIGGVAEAAACADKFRREAVAVTLTVSPCWCYGSETMDMDRHTVKGVWGFNGTERPGAVYLAAVLAAHSQKGLPAFGIYGHDVQNADADTIPADVEEKLLRFGRAAIAVAEMRGESYLSIGSVAMGIAGSILSPEFYEQYLDIRCESVDSTEIIRRVNEGIYDPEEFAKADAWVRANCVESEDFYNTGSARRTPENKREIFSYCTKMAMIARDLMVGNPRLAEMGFIEESCGHNAIMAGFQGQRQWTDHMPNGDFMETILNSSFDWNGIRAPYVLATENDGLNGVAMLFGRLLTNSAAGFSDVRTYWSPAAVKQATGEIVKFVDNGFELEVNVSPKENTVWLSQAEMSLLFSRDISVISRHIKNVLSEGECDEKSNLHFLQIPFSDKPTVLYSLDVIISVGYRVKSQRGVVFRRWATSVLKQYMLKGYAVDQARTLVTNDNYLSLLNLVTDMKSSQIKLEDRVEKLENKYPELAGKVFYDGQMWDAVFCIEKLISKAMQIGRAHV